MRKISLLIAKVNYFPTRSYNLEHFVMFLVMVDVQARITNNHEVLEIGCGWGSLALEVVKQIGCRYTGIMLSEEQLKYAQEKVKEAGLEDHIKLLLCDYRQLPKFQKYDRIISCGMLEVVGHECMGEFFGCCESLLTEDRIFVLQVLQIFLLYFFYYLPFCFIICFILQHTRSHYLDT
ncbi:sphingolipid C9-methyltransferase 1-like [Nymphaea colorata]|nr:sphingolipid C9-methyltransferase 1-like [Nymphaea colorata]